MEFPVDLLADVSQAKLEKLANDYMSELLYSNPDAPEHLTLSDSTQVSIDVSSVSLIPLYGSSDNPKILALFSPWDTLNVVALYLLDRWWTVDDILLTTDPKRNGVVEVATLGERIVLYVLNRYIYRTQEMSPEERPFPCHGEKDRAKILWINGEAIGFYSFNPPGSLWNAYSTRCYQLPVMNSIYVRKSQRGKGFGLQMLEDFVLSFKGDCLGLRFPLTTSMYKVCEKFLCENPGNAHLLWEVEAIGAPNQRTSIANKIKAMDFSVSRELSFTEETQVTAEATDSDVVMEEITTQIKEPKSIQYTVEIVEEVTVLKTTKEVEVSVTARGRSSGSKQRKMEEKMKEDKSEKIIRIEDIEAESPREEEDSMQIKQLAKSMFREIHREEVNDTVTEEGAVSATPDSFQALQDLEEAPTAVEPKEDDTTQDQSDNSQHSQITVENVATEVEEAEEEFEEGNAAVLVVSEEVSALCRSGSEAKTLHRTGGETKIELAEERLEERVTQHVTTLSTDATSDAGDTGNTDRTIAKAIQTVQSETIRRRSGLHKTTEEEKSSTQDGERVLRGRSLITTPAPKRKYTRYSQKVRQELPKSVDVVSTSEEVESAVSEEEKQEDRQAEDTAETVTDESEKEQKGEEGEKPLIGDDQEISDDVLEEPPLVNRRSRRRTKPKSTRQSEKNLKQKENQVDESDQGPGASACEEAPNTQMVEYQQVEHEETYDTAEEITVLKKGTIQTADEVEDTTPSTEVNMEDQEKKQELEEAEGGAESSSVMGADIVEEPDSAAEPLKPTVVLDEAGLPVVEEHLDTENDSEVLKLQEAETPGDEECDPVEKEHLGVIAAEDEETVANLVQEEETCTSLPTQEETSEVGERVDLQLSELKRVSVCLVDLKQSHHEFQEEIAAVGKNEQSVAEGEEEQMEEATKEEEETRRNEDTTQAEGKQGEESEASEKEDTSDEKIQENNGKEAATSEETIAEPEAEMEEAEEQEGKTITEEKMVEERVSETCADGKEESPVEKSAEDSLNPDVGDVTSEEESPVVETRILRSGRKTIKAKPRSKTPKSPDNVNEPQRTVEANDALTDEPAVETRILKKGRGSAPTTPRYRSKRAYTQSQPEEIEKCEVQEEEEEQLLAEENIGEFDKEGESINIAVNQEEEVAEVEEVENVAGDKMAEKAAVLGGEDNVVETVNESKTETLNILSAEEVEEANLAGKAEEDEISESACQEPASKAAELIGEEQSPKDKDKTEDTPPVEGTSLSSKRKNDGDEEDKEEELPKHKSGRKRPRVDYKESNEEDDVGETDATDKDQVETDVDKLNMEVNETSGENVDSLNLVLDAEEHEEEADSDRHEEEEQDTSEGEEAEPMLIGKRVLRGRSIPALVITPRSKARRSSARVHKAAKEAVKKQTPQTETVTVEEKEASNQAEGEHTSETLLEDEAGGTREDSTEKSVHTTAEIETGEMGELEEKRTLIALAALDEEHSTASEKCQAVETDIMAVEGNGGGEEDPQPMSGVEEEPPVIRTQTQRSGTRTVTSTSRLKKAEDSKQEEEKGDEEEPVVTRRVLRSGKKSAPTTSKGDVLESESMKETREETEEATAEKTDEEVCKMLEQIGGMVEGNTNTEQEEHLHTETALVEENDLAEDQLETRSKVMVESMDQALASEGYNEGKPVVESEVLELPSVVVTRSMRSGGKTPGAPQTSRSRRSKVQENEKALAQNTPDEDGSKSDCKSPSKPEEGEASNEIEVDKEEPNLSPLEERGKEVGYEESLTVEVEKATSSEAITIRDQDTASTNQSVQEEETCTPLLMLEEETPSHGVQQNVEMVPQHSEHQRVSVVLIDLQESQHKVQEEAAAAEEEKGQREETTTAEVKEAQVESRDLGGVEAEEQVALIVQDTGVEKAEKTATEDEAISDKEELPKTRTRRGRKHLTVEATERAEAEKGKALDAGEQEPIITEHSTVEEEKENEDDKGETSTTVEQTAQDGEEYADQQQQIKNTNQVENVDSEMGVEAAILQQETPESGQIVEGETMNLVVREAVEGEQSVPTSEVVMKDAGTLEEMEEEDKVPITETRLCSGKKTVEGFRSKESAPEHESAGESRVRRRGRPRKRPEEALPHFQPEEKEEETEAQEEGEDQGSVEKNKDQSEVEGERVEEKGVEADDVEEEAAGEVDVAEVEETGDSAGKAEEKEINEQVSQQTKPGEEQPEGDKDKALDSPIEDKVEEIQPQKRRSGRKRPRVDYRENDEDGEAETYASDKEGQLEMDVDKALDTDKQKKDADPDKGDEEEEQETLEEEEDEPIVIGKRVLRGRSIPAMVITPHSKSRRSSARHHKAEEMSSSGEERSPKRSLRKRKITEPTPTRKSKRRSHI